MDSENYKEIITMYERIFALLIHIQDTQTTIIKILDRVQERMTNIETRVDKLEGV